MKRDFELVRRILLDIERVEPGGYTQRLDYPEYDHQTIAEHMRLLVDAGLVRGEVTDYLGGGVEFYCSGLTWQGHDFLDVAKDETIWTRAKHTVLKPTAAITFDLLLAWLKEQAKRQFGLP